jgi:hypothetical protein
VPQKFLDDIKGYFAAIEESGGEGMPQAMGTEVFNAGFGGDVACVFPAAPPISPFSGAS